MHNPFTLATVAEVSSPDSTNSPGAAFLILVAEMSEEWSEYTDDRDDAPHLIADSAVPIYTGTKWETFTDLGAWTEDIDEFGPIVDMDTACSTALYLMAVRLATNLIGTVDDVCEEAHKLGHDAGVAAGSWVTDGNTTTETYERILAGLNNGDPEILDALPSSPVSGEWADGPTAASVLEDVGTITDDEAEHVLRAYEDGFAEGVSDEVERACLANVGEVAEEPVKTNTDPARKPA